jgi:hypothetical protein
MAQGPLRQASLRRLGRVVILALAAVQAAWAALNFFGRESLRIVNGLGVAAAARFSFHGSSIARPPAEN